MMETMKSYEFDFSHNFIIADCPVTTVLEINGNCKQRHNIFTNTMARRKK